MAERRKSRAAITLGRMSGKNLTNEQRIERARTAAQKRWRKAKAPATQPCRWYGLLLLPADYEWKGTEHAAKVLDAAYARPESILWSRDRAEVVERSQQADLRDRNVLIIDVDYDPTRFTIQREYKPD